MMKKAHLFAVLVCSLSSILCFGGQAERHHFTPEATSTESAIEFTDSFYGHLNRGMSRRHLEAYWSRPKLAELDRLTVILAQQTGKELAQESQRLMDLIQAEARCEGMEFVSAESDGNDFKSAKLEYRITNHCASWRNPAIRTIRLHFSTSKGQWLIDGIEDGEIQ